MSNVNTTENVRDWLRSCPAVSRLDLFGIDYMGKDPTQYAIYTSPSPITYTKDILGNLYMNPVQELNYTFLYLVPFSKDIDQSAENLNMIQETVQWIIRQNNAKNLPEIAEGTVISIMPTLTPYVFDADSDSGRYQIQIKIRYRPTNN